MRNSGEFEMQSRVGQEAVAEQLIRQRFKAEKALHLYRQENTGENLDLFREQMNLLHRLTKTKWSGTGKISPPSCLFKRVGEGQEAEKLMKSFLDNLTADELIKVLDKIGQLYEKLNLHGVMKENSMDQGMGGKSAAQKAKEKAKKER